MTTKKRQYEKPSMKVFMLKQQPQLLVGSSGTDNYTPDNNDYNW
jgi:hypothetical protein